MTGEDRKAGGLESLTTEARNEKSEELDQLSTRRLVGLMNEEDASAVTAVAAVLDDVARAIDAIGARMSAGGRLIYVGAGTSGRLGVLDAAECPPTFNAERGQVLGLMAGGPAALLEAVEGAEDSAGAGAIDIGEAEVAERDTVVGITASGRTPYVLGALDEARRRGALTIGFACNADADIRRHADLCIIPVVGPEVLTGSTRLKAGTATKMVLNMLSTGVMVRLGKTFGNLMVDLQATNEKLQERSVRIVAEICGCSRAEAVDALEESAGEVKVAVLVRAGGLSPAHARQKLKAADGHLRSALCSLPVIPGSTR